MILIRAYANLTNTPYRGKKFRIAKYLQVKYKEVLGHEVSKQNLQNLHKKTTLWPLFMEGVQLPQGYRATSRRQFTTKFPEIPGTHFIDLGRTKG